MHNSARPLSPHIQIYRKQLTSVLSITHRATGIALLAGSLLLVYWLVALSTGPQSFTEARSMLGSWLGRTLLFGFTVALYFHLGNGIRHLFWDAGKGFDMASVYASGRAVVVVAVALSVATWALGYTLR